ncbi:MAG: helix-turn-helix domain-containing protein [Candidatus Promineifilaceae bacterium]|nr:helix-turn-helix domain-containing protein [Candidatus Promineifilaceae bacterium]
MSNEESLLRPEEQIALQKLAQQQDIEGQRAAALLAIDNGKTQRDAAQESGLSKGQVQYILRKFREQRLLAFPDGLALLPPDEVETDDGKSTTTKAEKVIVEEEIPDLSSNQIGRLLRVLDGLIKDLRSSIPDAGQSPYSPLRMLTLVRDSISRYTPDVQQGILAQFQDMSREDLLDLDTWKGIAYMIAYSVQFQASQTRDVLNERLPQPIKPDTIYQSVRGGADWITPEIAKDMANSLEGASREDLVDPDTWKGLAYMVAYSAQFQAGETKNKLNERLPEPVKPDTLYGLFKDNLDRFTPEVAKEIISMFEGASKEDLLDIDTWKGVWYMLTYSLQFQVDQLKQRITGEDEEE